MSSPRSGCNNNSIRGYMRVTDQVPTVHVKMSLDLYGCFFQLKKWERDFGLFVLLCAVTCVTLEQFSGLAFHLFSISCI